MKIEKYIQGKDDKKFFALLGFWLTSQEVHKELGTAITSKSDDVWYVQTVDNNAVSFALCRKTKSTNAMHLRFIYGLHKEKLLDRVIVDCRNDSLSTIWTNARDTENLWSTFGFVNTKGTDNTGKFVRFEKELKND